MALHNELTPENIKSKLNIPPNLKNAFDRVTTAGMKVLYDPESQAEIKQHLAGPGDMGTKLGEGIATIMLHMFQQSNATMPPNVMIPAGIFLVVDAADFLEKSGKYDISDADTGNAIQLMIQNLMKAFNINKDNAPQLASQLNGQSSPGTMPPPPPAGGIIQSAQGA